MFAIVECKGFQYRVAKDDVLQIPLTDAEPGSTLSLDRVLVLGDGAATRIGTPTIPGAVVTAEVVGHGRGKKVIVGKYKKRKGYRRRKGHRQDYTEIRIQAIQA